MNWGVLFLGLLALSALVGLGVFFWCARLVLTGKWKQSLSILAVGSLAGLSAVGFLAVLLAVLGEKIAGLPNETVAAIFVMGFAPGSFAMAVSFGLWPFIKQLVYQSRRWADRR